MKKTLSLVFALVLAVFAFTGCSGTTPPSQIDRWEAGETRTYKISMITETSAPDDYYDYPETAGVQVKPDSISDDSYMTYEISEENGNWVLEIKMTVKQTYSLDDFTDNWQSVIDDSGIYTVDNGSVTFTSTMTSRAVFGKIALGGAPVSSSKTVKGAVVYWNSNLDKEVAYNDYSTETTYSDGSAATKFTDNTGDVEGKLDETTVSVGTDLIFDNEAMLLAIRSIDMAGLAEASSTTLNFFNSTEQATQEVTVAYDGNSPYTLPGDSTEYIRVGAVPTGKGYPYYYYCEQTEKMAPPVAGDLIYKYVIVRMSQGYMHFDSTASA